MKKSRTIFKKIRIAPYSANLWLLITNNPTFEIYKLNQQYKELQWTWEDGCAAVTASDFIGPNGNALLVVFDAKHFEAGFVTHEVIHIKNAVFKHAGLKHDSENDEPEAYLCGWLAEEIHKAYLEYKKL